MIQLETERLIMRMWREEDFEAYAGICADSEVMRFLTKEGKPLTRPEAWRHLAFLIGHWHLRGYGHWAVEERASGELIGRIGFLNPEGWPDFEIGWALGRVYWGKGFAIEGARRALEYAFTELDREHVVSIILPGNQASIGVAERLGESFEGRAEVGGMDVLVYGMDRAAWRAV